MTEEIVLIKRIDLVAVGVVFLKAINETKQWIPDNLRITNLVLPYSFPRKSHAQLTN
jgi:hypothetical protein